MKTLMKEDPVNSNRSKKKGKSKVTTSEEGSCAAYATEEDQEGVVQEEQDVIDRYYFSRYGRNDLNLIRYGERSCFSTLNQELAWRRFLP